MRIVTRAGLLATAGALALMAAGCGESRPDPVQTSIEGITLRELGEVYRAHSLEKKAPPKAMADLVSYERGFPRGLAGVRGGEVQVYWGGALSSPEATAPGEVPSDKVLAFETKVPKEGGYVLLADRTVKKMTPEEFSAAPKAAEVASGAKPATKGR